MADDSAYLLQLTRHAILDMIILSIIRIKRKSYFQEIEKEQLNKSIVFLKYNFKV